MKGLIIRKPQQIKYLIVIIYIFEKKTEFTKQKKETKKIEKKLRKTKIIPFCQSKKMNK